MSDDDLAILFSFHRDPESNRMAAFTAPDPDDEDAFRAWWGRLRSDGTVRSRVIDVDGEVVGSISSWLEGDDRFIAYWLGREHWGSGYATAALAQFIGTVAAPPLWARVAADNTGSIRVLEKNGFRVVATESGFANARGAHIEELLMHLA